MMFYFKIWGIALGAVVLVAMSFPVSIGPAALIGAIVGFAAGLSIRKPDSSAGGSEG